MATSEFVWVLTEDQKDHAKNQFQTHDPEGTGFISGEVVQALLTASKLKNDDLAQIWTLSAQLTPESKENKFNLNAFTVAQFLVFACQTNIPLPVSLPQCLRDSLPNPVNLPSTDPFLVTPELYQKHKSNFDQIAESGILKSGPNSVNFFKLSGLDTQILAKVWTLSDTGNKGYLNEPEFVVAMQIVSALLQGIPLPQTLPESLIQSVKKQVDSQPQRTPELTPEQVVNLNLDQILASAVPPLTKAQLASIYGVDETEVEPYDSAEEIKKLNTVPPAQLQPVYFQADAIFKKSIAQLEEHAKVYHSIVERGTLANSELSHLESLLGPMFAEVRRQWEICQKCATDLQNTNQENKELTQLLQSSNVSSVDTNGFLEQSEHVALEINQLKAANQKNFQEQQRLKMMIETLNKEIDPNFELEGVSAKPNFQDSSFPSNNTSSLARDGSKAIPGRVGRAGRKGPGAENLQIKF